MDASKMLLTATYNNNVDLLLTSILNGDYGDFDMNARGNKGKNCFHIAAKNGLLGVMDALLQRDLTLINVPSSSYYDGASALHFAVDGGYPKVVKLLLNRGANINIRNSEGRTALHLAAKNGYVTLVEILLMHGARVNDLDNSLNNALLLSVAYAYKPDNVVECLSMNGCFVNHENQIHESALSIAVSKGLTNVVKLLVAYGANPNVYCYIKKFQCNHVSKLTLLQLAAYEDTADVIDALVLEGNLDINGSGVTGQTPFEIASKQSNVRVARRLLDFHCDTYVIASDITLNRMCTPFFTSKFVDFNKLLWEHCVKLTALNCWVSSSYMYYFATIVHNPESEKFKCKCEIQAELLKRMKVKGGGTDYNVSCYDILASSLEHATTRLRNFDLTSICYADFYQVPEYREMILCRLRLIQKRLALIAVSENNFNNRVLVLPQICFDNVICHLSNNDLHRMNSALSEVGQDESENNDTEIQYEAI